MLGTSTFGGAGADVALIRGVSDCVDLGVIGGLSGSVSAQLKALLVHRGGVWLAAFATGRGYFHVMSDPIASAGLIATFGDGPTAASVGGFYGHWFGVEDAAGVEDPRSRFAGGGLGIQRVIERVDMRAMLELQRYGFSGDGATAILFTAYARPMTR